MAASPIALFPFMRTLATVDLYCHFRTYNCTSGTACTFATVIEGGYQIPAGIQFVRQRNHLLGAKPDTEFASLTKVLGNFNISLHSNLNFRGSYPQ
jgi:hypothetical protein